MTIAFCSQLLKYGLVGGCALGVDVSVFLLMRKIGCDVLPANVLARFVGAVSAFGGNFVWTFSRQLVSQTAWRSAKRYILQWVGATVLSTVLLSLLIGSNSSEIVTKIGVEVFIVGINFLVAKYWVFR